MKRFKAGAPDCSMLRTFAEKHGSKIDIVLLTGSATWPFRRALLQFFCQDDFGFLFQ